MKENTSRRLFLKKATLSSAAFASAPLIFASSYEQKLMLQRNYESTSYSINDQINLGLIGTGIQGISDTLAALGVEGVKMVAACDLYTGRLDRAKELWGNDIFTTRDYRELLNRKDVDAVIIATPDHWHQKIAIDALKAGKAVYCEKPMVQKPEDGHAIIAAQKASGKPFQVGSQGLSSLGNEKAKKLYEEGAIGDMVMLDFYSDRYSAEGAWQYPIPPDANPNTVDFDTFLGKAPKVPFDTTRFFRWRNYQDYGTGIPGDMFVHAFSTLNFVLSSLGPIRAQATGGLRLWKDGRDVPDIALCLYDFPKTDAHAAFNASMRVSFVAGGGGGGLYRLYGTEGYMDVDDTKVKLVRTKLDMYPHGYSMMPYTEAIQSKLKAGYAAQNLEPRGASINIGETIWEAPDDYKGANYDHCFTFFQAVRGKGTIVEDATFGLRAAGAAIMANQSYFQQKAIQWDPIEMKII